MDWVMIVSIIFAGIAFIAIGYAAKLRNRIIQEADIAKWYKIDDIIQYIENEQHEYRITQHREPTVDEITESLKQLK